MRLLLDTHYVYTLAGAPVRLSVAERDFLARPPAPLIISAVSIWEVRLKWHALHRDGTPKGPAGPQDVLRVLERNFPAMLPLLPSHAATRLDEALAHHDPFDELLLVQAQIEGFRLLTRDSRLVDHPLAMWIA